MAKPTVKATRERPERATAVVLLTLERALLDVLRDEAQLLKVRSSSAYLATMLAGMRAEERKRYWLRAQKRAIELAGLPQELADAAVPGGTT